MHTLAGICTHCYIVLFFYCVVAERPSDGEMNPTILYIDEMGSSGMGVVLISWAKNTGNYDLSHYTVELFVNYASDIMLTLSVVVSAENTVFPAYDISTRTISVGSTPAVMLPVEIGMNVYARVTTTSKCNQTSIGVKTGTIRSEGKFICSVLLKLMNYIFLSCHVKPGSQY